MKILRIPRPSTLGILCACLIGTMQAHAQETHVKPGLWEMKMSMPGQGEGMTMQTCVGPQTSPMRGTQTDRGTKCEKENVWREGDRMVFEAVCREGKQTITSRGTIAGKLDSQYRIDVTNRYDPPMRGRTEDSMSMAMRLLGPCKPGMKPGDMSMEGVPGMPPGTKMPR